MKVLKFTRNLSNFKVFLAYLIVHFWGNTLVIYFSQEEDFMRIAKIERKSKETDINLSLNIDGTGKTEISSGFGLLDHFLTLLAFWGEFDLILSCKGDTYIDNHHTAEDIGLCLGSALLEAMGDKVGIVRVGNAKVPMDEALTEISLDLSGRAWIEWRNDEILPPILAQEESDIWREFYKAFAFSAKCNLHVNFLYGKNGHHLLESVAKGVGLALKQALKIESKRISSTKGLLD